MLYALVEGLGGLFITIGKCFIGFTTAFIGYKIITT
jgi:hypothetical protein